MKSFLTRVANIAFIVALLFGYQAITVHRQQNEEIAKLNIDLKTAQIEQKNAALMASIGQENVENTIEGDVGEYLDGEYQGEAQGFGGIIRVSVSIVQGNIEQITITSAESEDSAYLTMAQDIIPSMVEAQSAEVDTISGATFSSTGIKNAVIQALEGAKK